MTPTEIAMVAGSPIVAAAGAALYKAWLSWRAHRERVELRRIELEELRAKNEHSERERKLEIEEQTGKHELASYREQARTLERLWERSDADRERSDADRARIAKLEAQKDECLELLEAEQTERRKDQAECDRRISALEALPTELHTVKRDARTALKTAQIALRRSDPNVPASAIVGVVDVVEIGPDKPETKR